MGKHFDSIPKELIPWIEQQKIFWVATAPLSEDGHINVSPKGVEGTFHLVDENKCWYEDLTGSGIETIAHLRENARITIMFSAFEGPPRILRFWGKGTVYEVGTPEYDAYIRPELRKPGSRAVIMIQVHKVGTSCGYAVPFFTFDRYRTQLESHFARKELQDLEYGARAPGQSGVLDYWAQKNIKSLDGLPGLQQGIRFAGDSDAKLPLGYIGVGEAQKWRPKEATGPIKKSRLAIDPANFDWLMSTQAKMTCSFLLGVILTTKLQPYILSVQRG